MAKSYNIERGLILEKLPTCPVNSPWLESQIVVPGVHFGPWRWSAGTPSTPLQHKDWAMEPSHAQPVGEDGA